MSRLEKLTDKILGGRQDTSVTFDELRLLLTKLGFAERIRGSHHHYRRDGFDAINLQPAGKLAKVYQVRQVRDTLKKGGY